MFDLREGETALDIAEKKKNTEIVIALKSKIEENKKEEENKLKESTSFSIPQPPTEK